MKKLFTILTSILLTFVIMLGTGCGSISTSIFKGDYTSVSAEKALSIANKCNIVSVNNTGLKIEFDIDDYGEEQEVEIELSYSTGRPLLKMETEEVGVDLDIYYIDGYAYAKGNLDGDITKVKYQTTLKELIFNEGTQYEDEASDSRLFDPRTVISMYRNYDGVKFYTETTNKYVKIKVTYTLVYEMPNVGKETTVRSYVYVFDKSYNYVASMILVTKERVYRGSKETSKKEYLAERYDGKVKIPSSSELAKYSPLS